jgi:hypothetical protein
MITTPTHKQTITFTGPQIAYLKLTSATLGISVADLVRRIIDEYRERSKT